jgi:hypothetical protein
VVVAMMKIPPLPLLRELHPAIMSLRVLDLIENSLFYFNNVNIGFIEYFLYELIKEMS